MLTRPDLRLLPSATVLWVLAALGVHHGPGPMLIACGGVVVLALLAGVLGRRPAVLRAVLAHLALLGIGASVLTLSVHRHESTLDVLREAQQDGRVLEVEVTARSDAEESTSGPAWARGSQRFFAVTDPGTLQAGTEQQPVTSRVPVMVSAGGEGDLGALMAAVRSGDRVTLRGTARVDGTFVIIRPTRIEHRGNPAPWRRELRETARGTTAHLPDDEAALVRGMSTGDTHRLTDHTAEVMRRGGITHLVAVSGTHLGLVLLAVLAPLLLLGVPRRPRIALAALALGLYVVIVGPQPSVLRATTMATPILLARFLGVRASPVAALALTVATWSVLSPQTSVGVGFVLSASATAAILLIAPPLARRIVVGSRERIPEPLALAIAVPLVAQVACTPVLVLLTPEISIWAVTVNMAVAPLVGPITVMGLLSLVLGPLWPTGAVLLADGSAAAAHMLLLIAGAFDALPGARIATPEGLTGVLTAIGVITLTCLAIHQRHRRIVRWGAAVVAVVVLIPPLVRLSPLAPAASWRIAACDVGQGDAVLLRGDSDRADPGRAPPLVLVDTGPEPEALTACLDRLGIDRIDLLVLTHPHADHTGGIGALTGSRAPERQWICPIPDAALQAVPGVDAEAVLAGDREEFGDLDVAVIWPPSLEDIERTARLETSSPSSGVPNNCSVTLGVTWADGTRFVGLGDLEPHAQAALAEIGPGPADVVKVAHHGSRRQDPTLYAALAPDIALITVGEENTFGHPTPQLLAMLDLLGARTVRTDRDGIVLIEEDGGQLHPRSVGGPR